MQAARTDPLDLSTRSARDLQQRLAPLVECEDRLDSLERIAGLDVGLVRDETSGVTCARAAAVVLSFPDLAVVEQHSARLPVTFPYVPGLLSFREIPALLEVLALIADPVQLLMCDGHGLAHPRRFGLACHLGLVMDVPSIGVAKSRLVGRYEEPGEEKGDHSGLYVEDDEIGRVLRTRRRVKPVFVSVGHRVSLATAVRLTLACTTRFRIPQPTRLADKLASR